MGAVLQAWAGYNPLDGSPVSLIPMPDDPAPEVAVLPMRGWVRRKSLDTTNEYKITRTNI